MQDLRAEIEEKISQAQFIGYVMVSTSTNRNAMKTLQINDPNIVVLPCAAHAFSLIIKHINKFFAWVAKVFTSCNAISEKLRSKLHN